jgi:hypothetical protein
MKVVIAGSRTLHHLEPSHQKRILELIDEFEAQYGKITIIVSGCAVGPDRIGENCAQLLNIGLAKFPAKWDSLGKAAGIVRNDEMAEYADAGIILWDGESRGTKHMAEALRKRGKPVMVDTRAPIVKYVHQPTGIIKRVTPYDYSKGDPAYD